MKPAQQPRVEGSPDSSTARQDIRRLHDLHHDFIWRNVRRLGVPLAHVDDAVQQVFLTAFRRLSEIRPGAERAFLFGVAVRVSSDARRAAGVAHGRSEEPALLNELADPAPGPEELMEKHRARALLDTLLAQMSMELRTVFVLCELEEMTMAEVAELTDLRPGTVASRLRRARSEFARGVKVLEARARAEARR